MKEEMKQNNLLNAEGVISYTFLNDYMFRAILQENKKLPSAFHKAKRTLQNANILRLKSNFQIS